MKAESSVVLMSKEQATSDLVNSSLGSSRHFFLAHTFRKVPELGAYLSRTTADAVVVDIDSYQNGVLRELSRTVSSHPDTCVVVISSNFREELVLEAMQAGARHFLRKHSIAEELDGVLERLLCDNMKDVTLGEIIPVFSASGGCGATMTAVNLANELRLLCGEPVLMIDLDFSYGTVSDYLGIRSEYGIADVVSRRKPIDKDLIETSACIYKEDFHALLSPAGINGREAHTQNLEHLAETLEVCREGYRYVVVDAPRLAPSATIDLAAASKLSLIVFQLTVKDLKYTRSLVTLLGKNEIPARKVIPVANRVKKRGPLVRLEDSKKVVGLDSFACIRSDWEKAMKSVNLAQPLAQAAKRSGLRKDLQSIANRVHNHSANQN